MDYTRGQADRRREGRCGGGVHLIAEYLLESRAALVSGKTIRLYRDALEDVLLPHCAAVGVTEPSEHTTRHLDAEARRRGRGKVAMEDQWVDDSAVGPAHGMALRLGAVEPGPLLDQAERSGWQRAPDHGQVRDGQHRHLAGISAWKCGGWWSFQLRRPAADDSHVMEALGCAITQPAHRE